ncbi:S-layer homology domain-containing protein [Bacillus dakarensis]|uniref:S-layer homology domain-containing protein n=1 Tax=Robertmurraya dakarensis TaxID=1926278 RepID=UPI000980CF68|nr:S-layer homology domain-containing protein [Bacillus dakarensis]
MKRLWSLFVIILLLLSFAQKSSAIIFSDVFSYKEEIDYLTSRDIIRGFDNGTFGPQSPIKRIQAVQMILREKGITDYSAPDPGFIDIKPGDYGYDEVAKAVSMGFISGKTDVNGNKYFDRYGTLTRGQMAKILAIAYNLKGEYFRNFSDVTKGSWEYEFVSALAANNITTGYEDNSFRPYEKLKRQHFAVFMARNLDDRFKPLPELQAHFIDVGQGDSSLILSPNGKTILIDGGRHSAGEKVVAYLKKAGVTSIDYLVATHPDADHIGGLLDVLRQIPVKMVIDSGKEHTSETYIDYLNLIQQKNIHFRIAKTGDIISIDPAFIIQVLNSGDQEVTDNNDASIVLKLSYNQIDFMFTGDAGVEVEERMLSRFNVGADILKVSHHGSSTGSSWAFINAVKPKASILSYGDNSYGHPTSEVVSRLKAAGSALYSTMGQGDIVVSTNGQSYRVSAKPWQSGTSPAPSPVVKSDIRIISVDEANEKVTIKNAGSLNVDMSGWKLVSVEGNQTYDFPTGFILKAGATVTIASGSNAVNKPPNILRWTNANIWNNSGDPAQLFNAGGGKVSEYR